MSRAEGFNGMWFALVRLEVVAGLSTSIPFATTSTPAYPLPPQTTLVGALAYPYLRKRMPSEVRNEESPAIEMLDKIVYVSAGANGYSQSRVLERVFQLIYLRKQHWERKELSFTVGIRGLTTYLGNELLILYIAKDRDVLRYCHGITRIGSKESHVAVRHVVIGRVKDHLVKMRSVETLFYTPKRLAYCANADEMYMPNLSPANFRKGTNPIVEAFYVPRGVGPMVCNPTEGKVLKIEDLYVIIPPNVVTR